MILPTKNLDRNRALIEIGGEILALLPSSRTNSHLWDDYKIRRRKQNNTSITYDWFILALDFLYLIGAVEYDSGKLRRVEPK